MNIEVKLGGQTILQGDVIDLLLLRSFQGLVTFHPPEGATVEIMAEADGYCLYHEKTITYEDQKE